MTTINVDLRSFYASNEGAGSTSVDSQIAAAQRQMAGLQKQLAAVLKRAAENPGSDPSKEAVKQAKLIQMQLKMLQARIAQLEELKAQKAREHGSNSDASAPATASTRRAADAPYPAP